MFTQTDKQLHWTQRVALVRHNLHTARHNGDFSFFKVIQAQAFLHGTDYVGILTAALENDADSVINTLDNLNSEMAYVFQDAFKSVCDSVKALMMTDPDDLENVKAQLRVDILQQIQRADFAVDRLVNSATALIQLQPQEHQNTVACTWILGATIITDAVSTCMKEINSVELYVNDFIRLENSWATVQSSVESCITALRGILNLMAVDEPTEMFKRRYSASSGPGPMSMFRKFSTAIGASFHLNQPPPPYKEESRSNSTASTRLSAGSTQSSPSALRMSFSNAIPTKLPKNLGSNLNAPSRLMKSHPAHSLSPIPSTPSAAMEDFGNVFDFPTP